MNPQETEAEKLERQHRAVADLRLDQDADEAAQKAVLVQAACKATTDHWPEMPESDRQRVVETVSGLTAVNYQLSVFREGWSTGQGSERIKLDPETAGPRILVRVYATAEADTVRMRTEAGRLSSENDHRPSLEDRLRRYLPPLQ